MDQNTIFHESNELSLSCALCSARPDVHCESDDAFLCYACDERVHRANFLVAHHGRAILCHRCRTPTQVHASGPSIDSAVRSTCHECANGVVAADESVSGSDSDSESGALDLNSCPEEEGDEEGDIDHVVPASIEKNIVTRWKRTRYDQEDTTCCSTSDPSCAESLSSDDDATSLSSDSNPRAQKRALFLNVVFSNAAEGSYI